MAANKRAAKAGAAAGEECRMEKRKRKAVELAAGDESVPKRKMTRLHREEIDSILATVMDDDRLPRESRLQGPEAPQP
jgi:hypothetical protein